MDFNGFNKPWIEHLVGSKDYVQIKQALWKMQNFMDSCGSNLPLLPLPLIIEKNSYEEICQASKHLIEAQAKIIKFLIFKYSYEEILEMFNLPASIEPFVDWEELQSSNKIIGRFDIIPSNQGYQFCEINADSSSGGLKMFECVQEYGNALEWPNINQGISPRKAIAEHLHKMVREYQFERVIIFSVKKYLFDGSGTVNSLYDCVVKAIPGIPVVLAHEESFPENVLHPAKSKKTLIFRIAIYKDIDFHPLLSRIFNSGATIINKFETEIRWNKNWFAIFHDPLYQELLSTAERAAISKFVPLTYRLSTENFEDFLARKERYVFKLNRSYGGAGVFIGMDHDKTFLRKTLTDLESWTGQEIIECLDIGLPEDESLTIKPHKVVLGLFHILDKPTGILVRANAKQRVINMKQGTKIGWAIPCSIEEREALMKKTVSK